MWIPDKSKSFAKNETALIVRDYQDIIFYDFPILFTGINGLNDRIVGSFVENENNTESYLHSVVSTKTFSRFVHQKINYGQLLKEAQLLFSVYWTGEKYPNVYWLNYEDIPSDYLPDDLAICPDTVISPSFNYEVKFEGGLANNHQAVPETLSKFQNKFASFLRNPLGLSALSNLFLNVFIQADDVNDVYSASSLKIKYHIELNEKNPTFFHNPEVYSQFLNKYISYCLHNLSEDVPRLFEDQNKLDSYNELLNEYETLIGQSDSSIEKRRDDFAQNMIQVARKLGDMTSIIKDEFDQVVLSSLSNSNPIPIGVLDESFGQHIEKAVSELENKIGKKTIKEDDFNLYEIHIYDLNTNTRKGRAILKPMSNDVKIVKPTFTILGTEPLTMTKYTESLHSDTLIKVKARATKTDGVIRDLEIEFE